MTVCDEVSSPKRSRLSLKGVRKYPPKPTLEETTPLEDVSMPTVSMSTEIPEPRTPDQPIVIPESPIKSSPEKKLEKPVIAAFNNLGNTCFLNSVLQILRYTPGFVPSLNILFRELISVHKQRRNMAVDSDSVEASPSWRLVRCLQKLFARMDRVESEFEEETPDCELTVQPSKLLETIRELNPMYEGNFQHDAQELLHGILCFIKDAVQELEQFHEQHPCYKHADPIPPTGDDSITTVDDSKATSDCGVATGRACSPASDELLTTCNQMDNGAETTIDATENDVIVGNGDVRSGVVEKDVTTVKFSRQSLSSLGDAIGDVVINDVTENVVFEDVTDYDAPRPNTPSNAEFPTADELFGDEGRMETVSMETGTSTGKKDRVHDTIDRVLRGETSYDWSRDFNRESRDFATQEELDFPLNLDNPSDALCEENRAIAESLKDAAAMASVASAFSDGKLTPKTPSPKSSPVKPASPCSSESSSPSVMALVNSEMSRKQTSVPRATSSSSAVKLPEEIEVLELEEEKSNDSVFCQPVGMRGGARRETRVVKTRVAPPVGKGRKRKPRGLSECNGEVSSRKIADLGSFHGKENIPVDNVFPPVKTYARKRPQPEVPVRRSPRKKQTDDVKMDITFAPIQVQIDGEVQTWEVQMPSPTDSVKSGPVDESRKRVVSPDVEAEPESKRQELPREEIPKKVVRRLGMTGLGRKPANSPLVDLTTDIADSPCEEGPCSPTLEQTARDNAQTVKVRLEKCNLKEKYPNLKVSTTPPKHVKFDVDSCRLVENLFEGRVALRTRCLECEASSDRLEGFQEVSVPVKKQVAGVCENKAELSDTEDEVPDPGSCHWMLRELSEVEHLRDENKYFCEGCRRLVEAERSTHYDVMPQILTLHLKRFAATTGFFGGLSKITDHVTIPLTLSCFSAQCPSPCSTHSYQLYGLIMHSGVTITSGHYVSYVKLNRDVISPPPDVIPTNDGTLTEDVTPSRLVQKWQAEGLWVECDDDEVKLLSDREFDNVIGESGFGTPYVLFYHLCEREQ